MRRLIGVVVFALVAGLAGGGCEKESASSGASRSASSAGKSSPSSSSSSAASSSPSVDTKNIKLEDVKFDDLVKKIEANRGKIVVVDFWATWCVPCRKEFPGLVALHRGHAKQGVVCMSASLDMPEQTEAALNFLKSKDADFANYRLEDYKDFNGKMDVGGIPVVVVYDRKGVVAKKFFIDQDKNITFTYADVNKLVDELLAKKEDSE